MSNNNTSILRANYPEFDRFYVMMEFDDNEVIDAFAEDLLYYYGKQQLRSFDEDKYHSLWEGYKKSDN